MEGGSAIKTIKSEQIFRVYKVRNVQNIFSLWNRKTLKGNVLLCGLQFHSNGYNGCLNVCRPIIPFKSVFHQDQPKATIKNFCIHYIFVTYPFDQVTFSIIIKPDKNRMNCVFFSQRKLDTRCIETANYLANFNTICSLTAFINKIITLVWLDAFGTK